MNTIAQRLVAIGLTLSLAERLEKVVQKWASASGPEWTVKRLKSLKVELISKLAGSQVRSPWVAHNKSGIPSGPIAELFRMAEKRGRSRFIAINSLMVYSSFLSSQVTKTQREKFFGSMESTDLTGTCSKPDRSFKIGTIYRIRSGKPWVNISRSADRFQPGPDGKSYPETDCFISLVAALSSDPILKISRYWPTLFNEVCPAWIFQDMWVIKKTREKYLVPPVNQTVGKVSYIQEPGYKLRAVANPNRVIQALLDPLKEALGDVLRSFPNDFTFDQDAGVARVQEWLNDGKIVHSVDLSDATNLFPRTYTFSCLANRIRCNSDDSERYKWLLELFAYVSECPWFTKEDGQIEVHRFTRGQPLGLAPSFFAFAISHNCLLMDICKDLGIESEGVFAILGDDVVISRDDVASFYLRKLSDLGCVVSKEKSLVSNSVAEFAGKIILADEIIPSFKWREIDDANVVDFCRNIGPSSTVLLSNRQASLINWLSDIPDILGGLSWNPQGLSFEERMESLKALFLLERDKAVMTPLRRVDVGLVEVANDKRLLELTPNNLMYGSDVGIIPSQGYPTPRWATSSFWNQYRRVQDLNSLLPSEIDWYEPTEIGSDSGKNRWMLKNYYIPFATESSDPTAKLQVPWFDIMRYFNRNQSRLIV
jgi:hypothetical protein